MKFLFTLLLAATFLVATIVEGHEHREEELFHEAHARQMETVRTEMTTTILPL